MSKVLKGLIVSNELKACLTLERLKELLSYDRETGLFTRNISRPNAKAGSIAGSTSSRYAMIGIDGRSYRAHRLAWMYVYGEYPTFDLDHRNRNRYDNRISNLRKATRSQNELNKEWQDTSATGYRGVTIQGKRYRADISIDNHSKYLGTFDTPEEAHEAYCLENIKIHGEFADRHKESLEGLIA